MLTRAEKDRTQAEIIILEDLVPSNHLLRKIEAAVDFSQIYGMVEKMYCLNNGRPSIDPVVLPASVRDSLSAPDSGRSEIECGIPLVSTDTTVKFFQWILEEISRAGYLTPEAVFLDGTHIKANANIRKIITKTVPQAAKAYERQLREEINAESGGTRKEAL